MEVGLNFNLINLNPPEWSKADWNDAYKLYCTQNMFGVKTKKQYYDFVMANHQAKIDREKPLDPELAKQWSAGRRAAKIWSKSRVGGECDQNGILVADAAKQRATASLLTLPDAVDSIAADVASLTHEVLDTGSNLSNLTRLYMQHTKNTDAHREE